MSSAPMETKLNRYRKRFEALKSQGKKAFIPYTLLGWPDKATSLDVIRTMIDSGVTALELGLPFSDPMSDGPVIQGAVFETLDTGFRVNDALKMLREIRQYNAEIPMTLMVYYNMVLARGIDPFFADLAAAGADGLLVVDLPPETAGEVTESAQKHGIQLIFIVSPLTSPERLNTIVQYAGGFLYAVSRLGITGTEERYDTELSSLIESVHTRTDLPVCVGFGISNPSQASRMFEYGADGVIVGSRIIQLLDEARGQDVRKVLAPYFEGMLTACNR